ncbi:phosphoglycerate mutase-like protein 4 [Nymphaea colorata]|nr:phosphoglycerate mutase-like protein 4 [Nymphaea colorata]
MADVGYVVRSSYYSRVSPTQASCPFSSTLPRVSPTSSACFFVLNAGVAPEEAPLFRLLGHFRFSSEATLASRRWPVSVTTLQPPLPPVVKMAGSTNEALSGSRCAPVDDETDGEVGAIPSNVTEIVVIRHGETTWNACGRIQGHLDSELNDLGRRQAMALSERLSKDPMIAAIYASDLKRAAETANLISKKCESVEVILDPGLKERHLGDLQGVVLRDACKIAPEAYETFVSSRTDLEIPGGGESVEQFHDRCISALERIASGHLGQRIVVVTHGGVIREFFNRAAPRGSRRGKILNVSVNVLRISDKMEWSIKSWGDVSHLDGVGYLGNAFGGDRTSG